LRPCELALTHDLIADEDWKGVTLQDLAARQLTPFIGEDASRVKSEGPQLMLSPAAAQNIGLALHELATNAVKYGALSQSQGTIHLTWQLHPPRWHIAWQERDGPQATAPVQKGFGHAVLARVVPEALDGETELFFDPKGFIWKLDMSAEHVL
jgi:two-component sensor histidine kinase